MLCSVLLSDNYTAEDAINPWQLLDTDRRAALMRAVITCVVVGIVIVLMGKGNDIRSVIANAVLYGLIGAVARLTLTVSGSWLLFARLWLPLTGRLPWRPKRFLEDAYQRGVLRQAGAVYQFRHARLRDHLAREYRTQVR